jgi:hypothetical protein
LIITMHRPTAPELIVKARYQRRQRRQYTRDKPVVVFSLGKVGTTSLARTIEATGRSTLHCHRIVVDRPPDPRWPSGRGRPYPEWRGQVAGRMLRTGQWDIVCGVRDPVARAASTLFQIGGAWESEVDESRAVDAVAESLVDLFDAGRAGLDWFDAQLRPVTGIDVFAEPFDPAAGWRIFESGRFRVLVIRFEDIARAAGPALAAHLGLPEAPEIEHRNEGGAKGYAGVYERFRRTADLPPRLLDKVYGSPMVRHFYTDEEREGFRRHWDRT